MKQVLILLVSLFIVGVVVIILALGYTGFMPGVSTLMGTNKPRDLGVNYAQSDASSFNTKAKVEITPQKQPAASDGKIIFSGLTAVDGNFTDSEISAKLTYSPWKFMPMSDVQVKLTGNGSVEVAGVLRIDRLTGFITAIGGASFSNEDVKKGLDYLKIAPGNPPIYAKGTASVTNNQVSVNIQSLEVGRIPVPVDRINTSENASNLAEHIIKQVPGANLETVKFEQGKMYVKGTIPSKQIVPTD